MVAIELAEEFRHFKTLVRICELHDNREQLHSYFDQFKEAGFGEALFSYHLNSGAK